MLPVGSRAWRWKPLYDDVLDFPLAGANFELSLDRLRRNAAALGLASVLENECAVIEDDDDQCDEAGEGLSADEDFRFDFFRTASGSTESETELVLPIFPALSLA